MVYGNSYVCVMVIIFTVVQQFLCSIICHKSAYFSSRPVFVVVLNISYDVMSGESLVSTMPKSSYGVSLS